MSIKQKLEKLASGKNTPCVTISLNTHRTHPNNAQDTVLLKKLVKEAEDRVIHEFGKRPASLLLEQLSGIENEIDVNYNLDSLHIYLSNDTKEIIKSAWTTNENKVHISNTFDVCSLIKSYNRSEEYFILLLSQSGVNLYHTINDEIINEVENNDFPFPEKKPDSTHTGNGSDAKHLDDQLREFLNKVDKALVKMHNETGLNCVVICTESNYSSLMQVADNLSIYLGYCNINYNNTAQHTIAKQSWELIKDFQHKQRLEAICEMKEAVGQGNVLTDLQEIFQAAQDGRGDLLIVHQDFSQAVEMINDRSFELINHKNTTPNTLEDITSNIAWDVLLKKGRVFFTTQNDIKEMGGIVLKTRY